MRDARGLTPALAERCNWRRKGLGGVHIAPASLPAEVESHELDRRWDIGYANE